MDPFLMASRKFNSFATLDGAPEKVVREQPQSLSFEPENSCRFVSKEEQDANGDGILGITMDTPF